MSVAPRLTFLLQSDLGGSFQMSKTAKRALVAWVGLAVLAFVSGPAAAEDRHVKVVNETRHTIVHFYASSIGAKTWEEDILGEDELAPGQEVRINIDDGTDACLFDF